MSLEKDVNIIYPERKNAAFRPSQIDFLFSVTRAHAKKNKLGDLNLFTQKLARLSFLLQIKKEHFSCMSILIIFCFE